MQKFILNKPFLSDLEKTYVLDVLESNWLSAKGKHTCIFEEKFADYVGRKYATAIQSGTAGLHLALKTLGVGPRDHVVIPNFSCGATISSVVQCGATPIVLDVDSETYALDATSLETVIQKYRPKALQMVHVYGFVCRDTLKIIELCKKYGVFLIEDASETLGASIGNRQIGSFGDISVFSIRSEKMIGVGEGGVICCDDSGLHERIESLASRSAPFRSKGCPHWAKYFYDGEGYNYMLPHLLGAVARGQIERFSSDILPEKKRVGKLYREIFSEIPDISLQQIIDNSNPAFWINSVFFKNLEKKAVKQIAESLDAKGVEIRSAFWPLSHMQAFKAEIFGSQEVGTQLFEKLLVLPSAYDLQKEDVCLIRDIILNGMRGDLISNA